MAFRSVYRVKAHSYTNKKGKRVNVKAHSAYRMSNRRYDTTGGGPLAQRAKSKATSTRRSAVPTTYTTRKGLGRRTRPAAVKKARRRAPGVRVSVPISMPSVERYAGARGNIRKMTQKHYVSNSIKAKTRRATRPTIPVSVRFRHSRPRRRS